LLRAQIHVTDQLDVKRTYDLKGAAVIAFERKFGKSIQEFAENPFMEHIMFLAYECVRRENRHDGLSFDEWVELDHTVDLEADNDPLPEAPTPTS
tara:strand:- start:11994 stop:12278 length:285 start_codon:yes stop_codon:yes gene_type:complete